MASDPTNPFAIRGRADYCWKFARWALNRGISHENVAKWDDCQWEAAAAEAGTKNPSERGRGQIIGYMTPNPFWTAARTASSTRS